MKMSGEAQQVKSLEAVKRSLAIANRVTSSAIVNAKKRGRTTRKSLSGGKRRRRSPSSPKRKSSPKRRRSPKRK